MTSTESKELYSVILYMVVAMVFLTFAFMFKVESLDTRLTRVETALEMQDV